MKFKEWMLAEDAQRTGAKLGLYCDIDDAIGQYPPLYATPGAADFITYLYLKFGNKTLTDKQGFATHYSQQTVIDGPFPVRDTRQLAK